MTGNSETPNPDDSNSPKGNRKARFWGVLTVVATLAAVVSMTTDVLSFPTSEESTKIGIASPAPGKVSRCETVSGFGSAPEGTGLVVGVYAPGVKKYFLSRALDHEQVRTGKWKTDALLVIGEEGERGGKFDIIVATAPDWFVANLRNSTVESEGYDEGRLARMSIDIQDRVTVTRNEDDGRC